MESKKYGTVTVNDKNKTQLSVIEVLKVEFNGGRIVSVNELEDNTFLLALDNAKGTGRIPTVNIWLTKDSLFALSHCIVAFAGLKGNKFKKEMLAYAKNNLIDSVASNNLKNAK